MRTLMAMVFGCAVIIGVSQAATSAQIDRGAQPAPQRATPADEDALDNASQYICQISPRCQQASQCTDYCAGGAPVCFQGCCSCAS